MLGVYFRKLNSQIPEFRSESWKERFSSQSLVFLLYVETSWLTLLSHLQVSPSALHVAASYRIVGLCAGVCVCVHCVHLHTLLHTDLHSEGNVLCVGKFCYLCENTFSIFRLRKCFLGTCTGQRLWYGGSSGRVIFSSSRIVLQITITMKLIGYQLQWSLDRRERRLPHMEAQR